MHKTFSGNRCVAIIIQKFVQNGCSLIGKIINKFLTIVARICCILFYKECLKSILNFLTEKVVKNEENGFSYRRFR